MSSILIHQQRSNTNNLFGTFDARWRKISSDFREPLRECLDAIMLLLFVGRKRHLPIGPRPSVRRWCTISGKLFYSQTKKKKKILMSINVVVVVVVVV